MFPRLMLLVVLTVSDAGPDDLALDSDLEPEDVWPRVTILVSREGMGRSPRPDIWANSAGDLVLTISWRAFSVSSSSSTLTLVTSLVSLKLLGKVE